MSRPPNALIFVYECPYCHEKAKYTRADFRMVIKSIHHSFKFSACPACKSTIAFRDSKYVNQPPLKPFETKLLEVTSVSKEIPPEYLLLPDLLSEAPISILRRKQFKPDAELAVRIDVWREYTSRMIYRQYEGSYIINRKSKWRRIKENIHDFLKTVNIRRKNSGPQFEGATSTPIPRFDFSEQENQSNLNRILQFDLADLERLEIYQQLGAFAEADELLDRIPKTTDLDHQPLDPTSYGKLCIEELRSRVQKRNKRPFILEDSYRVVNKDRELKSNLKKMLALQPDAFEKITIYQQLGDFEKAKELMNSWFGTRMMSNSYDFYDLAFHEEMERRINEKIRTPFELKRGYIVLDIESMP